MIILINTAYAVHLNDMRKLASYYRPILLGLIFIKLQFALDPQKAFTQYSRATWTQSDGLPQDSIRSLAQTTDGFLWIGTDDGLARFDGYSFTTFTTDNSAVPGN